MPKSWIRIGTCYLRPDQFLDHLMVIKSVRAFPLLSYCHKSIWAVKTVRHIFACAWLHTNIFDCLHIFDSLFMLPLEKLKPLWAKLAIMGEVQWWRATLRTGRGERRFSIVWIMQQDHLGGHNPALQTLYPPLPYIFWTVWTWGFTRWHPKYTIPIQKFE